MTVETYDMGDYTQATIKCKTEDEAGYLLNDKFCIWALFHRQIPAVPIIDMVLIDDAWKPLAHCPKCWHVVDAADNYCRECGQALRWSGGAAK